MWEVALTCKGHCGVLPRSTQKLLLAGLAGEILGAGEVEHQQYEAGWQQQCNSQGPRKHHGGPLKSQLLELAWGRPAMQILSHHRPPELGVFYSDEVGLICLPFFFVLTFLFYLYNSV